MLPTPPVPLSSPMRKASLISPAIVPELLISAMKVPCAPAKSIAWPVADVIDPPAALLIVTLPAVTLPAWIWIVSSTPVIVPVLELVIVALRVAPTLVSNRIARPPLAVSSIMPSGSLRRWSRR
jgi:hypothetical protein